MTTSSPGAVAHPDSGQSTRRADGAAVLLSVLCLIHCLALPLLAAVAPVVSVLSENELFHRVLVLLVAPITGWVAWRAREQPGFRAFLWLAGGGVVLLMVAALVEPLEEHEVGVTLVGALMLAVAHWRRLRAHGNVTARLADLDSAP